MYERVYTNGRYIEKNTLPELIALCKARSLKGYSGKKKAELVAMLSTVAVATTATATATVSENVVVHPTTAPDNSRA